MRPAVSSLVRGSESVDTYRHCSHTIHSDATQATGTLHGCTCACSLGEDMIQRTEGSSRWSVAEKVLGFLAALMAVATAYFGYKTATVTQAKEQAEVVADARGTDLEALQSEYAMLKGQYNAAQAEIGRLRAQPRPDGSIDNSPATTGVPLNEIPPLSTDGENYQFGPQTVNAKPYPRTLYFTDSCSVSKEVIYQLGYKYKRFHAAAGLSDNSATDSKVTFTVQVDNKAPEAMPLGLGQEPHSFDKDLTGAFRLTLSVKSDRCQETVTAVWIDPILEL